MIYDKLSSPSPGALDPICTALLDLAENEFRNGRFGAAAAVALLAHDHAPGEPRVQRFLKDDEQLGVKRRDNRQAAIHLARARAYCLLGDRLAAEAEFRAALTCDGDFADAHDGLASLFLPGTDYLAWLSKLHTVLRPRNYLEIGIARGRSLALAKPPTRAIGVDPGPNVEELFEADTQIFRETSDAFFSHARLESLLDNSVLDLAFIDGLHLFEQALKDFMNIELLSGRHTVVLIHDTIPLDERTQRRTRSTAFYTGDVWKTALCLKRYRPDLEIATIATPPTGLTIVTNLDRSSRILAGCYDEAVTQFMDLNYAEVENQLRDKLNTVPNDWSAVVAQLKARPPP